MTEPERDGNSVPVLHYAAPNPRNGSRLGWPIILGIFQFFWMAFFLFQGLDWDRPKELVRDSLFCLLIATPSTAAAIASFRIWRYHAFRTRRLAPMLICLCVCLISAAIAISVIRGWIVDVVLDPHGRWYPVW